LIVKLAQLLLECIVSSLCVIAVLQRKHSLWLLSRLFHRNMYTLYIY